MMKRFVLIFALLLIPTLAAEATPGTPTGRIIQQIPTVQSGYDVPGSGTYKVVGQIYNLNWSLRSQQAVDTALPAHGTFDYGPIPNGSYHYQIAVCNTNWTGCVNTQIQDFTCCSFMPQPTATPTATATATATATSTPTPTATATSTPTPTATATATPAPSNCLGVTAYPEKRPANASRNATFVQKPTGVTGQHQAFVANFYSQITGDCQGTTEQILEWAAKKWGLDQVNWGTGLTAADILKAQAVQESNWNMSQLGDWYDTAPSWADPGYHYPDYQSYCALQVMRITWEGSWVPANATEGQVLQSTAFCADYAAAITSYFMSGQSWLGSAASSPWDAIGAYFCGCGNASTAAIGTSQRTYVDNVKSYLANKPWQQPGF